MTGSERAHVIVLGNEKGGTGKSTAAMHLIVRLLRDGFRVGSIDLDARQGTLTRYLRNREAYNAEHGLRLRLPEHRILGPTTHDSVRIAEADERARFELALGELSATHDYVVIDTPAGAGHLSRLAHSHADTLITPLNDSLVDLDVLARIHPETLRILQPSHYAEMVWEQKKARAMRDGGSIDWIVMRNRIGSLDSHNKQAMERLLSTLARRIGFRFVPGFGERVIFRELFLSGLTLLDLRVHGAGIRLNMSHIAGRQEVRRLVEAIGLHRRRHGAEEGEKPSFGTTVSHA